MRVLLTNDDGVDAPGLHALAAMVVDEGHDVVVAAPLEDMSGSSAAIGQLHLDDSVRVKSLEVPSLPGIACWGVDGPPALAVMAAAMGGFGDPPELVVSGINPGANTGRSILHSGTVGAALTAANFGLSGLAVSITAGEPWHWGTATEVGRHALRWLVDAPARTVLNLNVPNVALAELAGVRWAKLATFGTVRSAAVESDGRLQIEVRSPAEPLPADTDIGLVKAGWAAITSITGVRATDEVPVAEAVAAGLAGEGP